MALFRFSAILLGVALVLCNCTTWVDVTKVTPGSDAKGIRYSLPAPFLLVQPQADGSASYSWVFLPDSDNTYAIEQHSILGKFTLDVTLSNMLLGKVNSKGDSTAVAAKLLDAAQATYVAKQQAIAAKKKTDTEALDAAKAAKRSAELALKQAQAESDAMMPDDSGFSVEQKRAAQLKLIDAQIAADHATQNLNALLAGGGAGDVPGSSQQQWGPILFRVEQDASGSVRLVAANIQVQFDTVTGAATATGSPTPLGADYTLTLQDTQPMPSARPLKLSITVTPAIAGVDAKTTSVVRSNGSVVTDRPVLQLSDDGETVTVTFANGLSTDSYVLTPGIIVKRDQDSIAKRSITFQVQ